MTADRRGLQAAVAAALVAVACTGGGADHFTAALVDVSAGRRMYVECAGVGAPTVVLVAGKGNRADTWSTSRAEPDNPDAAVFRRVSRFTRVCAYDRPATVGPAEERSRSDPAPEPVTAADGVADLAALLAAADVRGPTQAPIRMRSPASSSRTRSPKGSTPASPRSSRPSSRRSTSCRSASTPCARSRR